MQAAHKNVTLRLPDDLLRKFRVYAAEQNSSMTALLVEAIEKILGHEDEREKAGRRFLERIRRSPDRGTGGKIDWTREELYDR